MKHRGRHRRRRRGRALRATLAGTALALTAAATLISTSQAAGGGSPGALRPMTSAGRTAQLRLDEHLAAPDTLDTLTREMGGSVGVSAVLDSANHPMRGKDDCDDSERAALPVEPSATRAYCWDDADARTRRWLPRSVTTSGDAETDGRWGDDRVILSGWTHDTGPRGRRADGQRADGQRTDDGLARVAFIDANDPDHLAYRWVLLVAPRDGGKDFGAVRSRLGGMAWYQDKLLVTAESRTGHKRALYVFDMRRILRADTDSRAVGRVSGGFAAHGYRYVLPAIGSYDLAGGACSTAGDRGVPCPASVSVDRGSTPASLVANERLGARDGERARVWRYYFSTGSDRTGLLGKDVGGQVGADEAYETEASGARGVLSHTVSGSAHADWYLASPAGPHDRHGTLWRQDGDGATAAKCTADQSHACWGRRTGSLSYWPATGELWTQTDRTAETGRALYAVPLSSVDDSLD
ncbi:hypothetical protein ACFY93_05745 [Streptomyces sp. NPDC008313]|uniref:hypothetical protein n=1 Tax=Streptomyces sp. NPDC008313 TaxID=3364826 RepID=UPI0036E670F1